MNGTEEISVGSPARIIIRLISEVADIDAGWRPDTNFFGTVHEQLGINGLFKITLNFQ